MGRLVQNASIKWVPILSGQAPCQIGTPDPGNPGRLVACSEPAISFCDACGKPSCLHHGRIDSSGGILCFRCVAGAIAQGRATRAANGEYAPPHQDPRQGSTNGAPPQPPRDNKMTRDEALKLLGLKEGATDLEIRKAYRAAAKKWHPDNFKPSEAPAATAAFNQIQSAYDALKP